MPKSHELAHLSSIAISPINFNLLQLQMSAFLFSSLVGD